MAYAVSSDQKERQNTTSSVCAAAAAADFLDIPPISSYSELWKDLEVKDEDVNGEYPMIQIHYAPQAKRALTIFAALVKRKEVSDRMLNLTAEIIWHNSANYTAWYYRKCCLVRLKKDLIEELEYVRRCAEESEKNYQVWHHRRWVLLQLKDDCGDLARAGEALYSDSKNYCAWAHRQWLVRHFQLWRGETEFVEKMIDLDARNNSAWNYRHFLLTSQPLEFFDTPYSKEQKTDEVKVPERLRVVPYPVLTGEIQFALKEIERLPHNECAYRYLQSLLRCMYSRNLGSNRLVVTNNCSGIWTHATSEDWTLMIDQAKASLSRVLRSTPGPRFALEVMAMLRSYTSEAPTASKTYLELEELDPIRNNFWRWKADPNT